jgi:hypothetical protein
VIAMRGSTAVLCVAIGLGLTVGAPRVQAQGNCRYQCDLNLQQCRQSCVDAQSFDQCRSDCESAYQQCVMSCA